MQIHLLNMPRPALIELALGKLPRRYRRRADEQESSVRCLGVFQTSDQASWFVGLRFSRPKARPLYAQMSEARREGGWAIVAVPRSASFPWAQWQDVMCDADARRACRRLRKIAERHKKARQDHEDYTLEAQ